MAKIDYRKTSYFKTRPDVVKIFDDLDEYRDFCRFKGKRFDESDLYNMRSWTYEAFLNRNNPDYKPPRRNNTKKTYGKRR